MILTDTNILLLISALLIIAVINDLRFRKIPNLLTYPAMLIAIAYNCWLNGFGGFLFSIEGISVGIAVLITFHFMGGMGAGDVKLMGALGGFLGPKIIFVAFLFTAIIGGLHALVVLTLKGYVKETIKRYLIMLKTLFLTKRIVYVPASGEISKLRLCYGVSIAVGTALAISLESMILKFI